jgi:hypothetical protein
MNKATIFAVLALSLSASVASATPTNWAKTCAAAGNVPGTNRAAWCEAKSGCVPCPRPVTALAKR